MSWACRIWALQALLVRPPKCPPRDPAVCELIWTKSRPARPACSLGNCCYRNRKNACWWSVTRGTKRKLPRFLRAGIYPANKSAKSPKGRCFLITTKDAWWRPFRPKAWFWAAGRRFTKEPTRNRPTKPPSKPLIRPLSRSPVRIAMRCYPSWNTWLPIPTSAPKAGSPNNTTIPSARRTWAPVNLRMRPWFWSAIPTNPWPSRWIAILVMSTPIPIEEPRSRWPKPLVTLFVRGQDPWR